MAWWLARLAARMDRRVCAILICGRDEVLPDDLPDIMERGTRGALEMVRHEAIAGIADRALRKARPELFQEST